MDLTKREKIGLIGFLIIILVLTSFIYFKERSSGSIDVIKHIDTSDSINIDSNGSKTNEVTNTSDKNLSSKPSQIYVYITGEVNKPGVYILKDGDRVENLITEAGGLTKKADTLTLNLAAKLKDEDHIEVFPKGMTGINQTSGSNSSAILSNSTVSVSVSGQKININTASKEQLEELPRIGDALSQRIIDYRTQNGRFNDTKDITNVSGIGQKLYDSIKEKISVQ